MPELPEVETIKNELAPHVVGHKIESVDILTPMTVARPSPEEFRRRVTGRTITSMSRHGKYLFFHLSGGDDVLMAHMKLAGALLVNPEPRKHTHIILHLDNGTRIEMSDPRKFARMWLEKDESAVAKKLGPEPLDKDFTVRKLADILKKRRTPVKAVILQQELISGIGNMYADEALFDARIHPASPADSLTPAEVKKLHASIRKVLLKGIENKGASVRDYIRPGGELGHAHTDFLVAHGAGNKCPGCNGTIERIVVRGRGTYLCPKCQPEK
jgi:formamidopyrimidine-DNA glycosylase